MEDWAKRLLEVLVGHEEPLEVADLRRMVDVPGNDDTLLFRAIAKISRSLEKSGYMLVIEERACLKCNRDSYFTGENVLTCSYCKEDLVPPPKFCINPR